MFEMILYLFHQSIVNVTRINNKVNEVKIYKHTNAGTNKRLNAANRANSSADN